MNPSVEEDVEHLRRAIRLSEQARRNGNQPFGAVLVADSGEILAEAENAMLSARDVTAHAEMNALRAASLRGSTLAGATMYASGEPCPMCAGAMLYAGLKRVVFGIRREVNLPYHMPGGAGRIKPSVSCRDILLLASPGIEVVGPLLEEEARVPFEAYAARGSG